MPCSRGSWHSTQQSRFTSLLSRASFMTVPPMDVSSVPSCLCHQELSKNWPSQADTGTTAYPRRVLLIEL